MIIRLTNFVRRPFISVRLLSLILTGYFTFKVLSKPDLISNPPLQLSPYSFEEAPTLLNAGMGGDTITDVRVEGDDIEQGACNLAAPWLMAGNTTASDDAYATNSRVLAIGSAVSNCLDLQFLGFSIPSGAEILGITVTVERSANVRTATNNVTDNKITLIRGASNTEAQNKALSITWSTTDSTITYGSSSDSWAYPSWTPADINSPLFGVRIQNNRNRASGTITARVDYVSIAVTYVTPKKSSVASTVGFGCPSSDGSASWTGATAANLASDDGLIVLVPSIYTGYATVTNNIGDAVDTSACLDLTDFGFCICPNAIIDSITVEVDRARGFDILQQVVGQDTVTDVKIALLQPGGAESANKANTATNWPGSTASVVNLITYFTGDQRVSYGGDNWGVNWTPAMINDPGFGVRIQVRLADNAPILPPLASARIDEVLVKIHCSFPRKIYVDQTATGANTGLSWEDAFTDLQVALNACFVDTICVAAGTYYPAVTGRDTSFNIPDSAVVMGGFPAGGNGERDPWCYKTILSGEIQQDDDSTNNSYHVVTTHNVSDATVVDGFCIQDGYASAPPNEYNRYGGGWFNFATAPDSSNPTILNCTITGNAALRGGGMANFGDMGPTLPTLINCIISDNEASRGGGMFNYGLNYESSPTLINCILSGNLATDFGGAMYNDAEGNGDDNTATSHPMVINSTFNGNQARQGGATFNNGASGGDLNLFIRNSAFWNNIATQPNRGPVFWIQDGTLDIDYSLIQGGGGPPGDLTHSSITRDNGGNTFTIMTGPNLKFGSEGFDPLFFNAPLGNTAPTPVGNFRFPYNSPLVNMGNNADNPYPTDIAWLPRIAQGTIDIGPYEAYLNCLNDTIYVNADGTVPVLPLDSVLLGELPDGTTFLVNGIETTGDIVLDCEQLGKNNLLLEIVRNCLVDSCTKMVWVLDTFTKDLVCNDLVNVSLGTSCMKVIDPDDVLEDVLGCRNYWDIQLIYPFGTARYPEADKVDLSHIGYTLVYNAYEVSTGNKCWGYIHVEDKQPPQLNCSVDTITCYELPDLPLLAEGEDSCSGVEVKIVSDHWTEYGCDEDPVLSGYVVRTIQGSDKWGNFARCTDTIFIRKTSLDSLVCPELIELPCEITHQLYGSKSELKTPFTVDKSKVSPEYLLSLQKANWELKAGGRGAILDPAIIVVPQIEGKNIYPAAGGSCKITAIYKDTDLDVCGAGFKVYRNWIVTDWCTLEEEECEQYIKVIDTTGPRMLKSLATIYKNTNAHECVAGVVVPALVAGTDYKDCSGVKQSYRITYEDKSHPGKVIVLAGDLPSKTLYLPQGEHMVQIFLVDDCYNRTETSRLIVIKDITPPTPVCDEVTQVTVDPEGCWAKVKAKDLDNGSRDNCCEVLHFAVAHMDSVTYWRNYWRDSLEARCGSYKYEKDKEFYEFQIERWINAYVFKDEIKFDDCGPNQVVLRVYEACGVPIYDPHVWPCTEHQWFWYNTDQRYRIEHNWNFFHKDGKKDCNYRYKIECQKEHQQRGREICEFGNNTYPKEGGLCYAQYEGAVENLNAFCESDFYFEETVMLTGGTANPPGSYCSHRLYSDCMVQVLVDDKQAPEVHHLEDITVYCDDAPYYAGYPKDCSTGKKNGIWPGYLKDSEGTIHGYYGGLGYYDEEEHGSDCGHYDHQNNWAPKYCREWLYLDSFDTSGQIDPKSYFDTYVLFDKNRPQRELKKNEFSITENCTLNDATLTWTDEGDINSCGEGWIQRTWTIRDKCDNVVVAKQKVLVKHRSDFEVVFPEDKVVECDFLNSTEPEDTGEPEVTDDECEQVGIRYKDEIFTIEGDACYKIVRTWTLIDWCIYDPGRQERYPEVIVDDRLRADTGNRECVYRNLKDNNDGYMQYIQIIKVVDKVAPIVNTRDTIVCVYNEDCSADVIIPLSASDNCADPSNIRFRVQIDIDASEDAYNGRLYDANSIDQGGTRYETEFIFLSGTPGKHLVHIIGIDNCGNADTSTFRFELRDCKRPTPYCYRGLATVIMPSTGTVTVWAKDLDAGSGDNCTEYDNLVFSFSSDITQTSRVFTCADLPDGRSRTVPVEIWVTDEAGNQDHCSTYILLQDNTGNVCPDVAGLNVQIAGSVQTEGKEPVEFVTMNINGGGLQLNYETGVQGTYHFEALPSKSDYTIRAKRKDRPMNGVSTLDLILIQKHILGTEPLDSPYKIIAADADDDKQVTAIDLVELRKLILSTYEELPNADSWKFVPKTQQFSDPKNPWDFKTWMEMKEVEKDYMQEDWIGIKTGDVNASAAPHSLMGTEVRGNNPGLIFDVVDQQFIAGELVIVEFRSPNFRGISGFQGTVEVEGGRWVVDGSRTPKTGALPMSDQNFGNRKAAEGLITMSWNSNTGVDIPDQEVLFTLTFKAGQNGRLSEALRMGSQVTIAESYEGKGEVSNLGIRFVTPEG
ncbi:MAG TPA: hypothetical protein PKL70_17025, partial [Saprospiraceae bacterium]|nr:hypothetical protein [Saprospiraceae bacterium]